LNASPVCAMARNSRAIINHCGSSAGILGSLGLA
jgi:hypothetical protein